MITRKSSAVWKGNLRKGEGTLEVGDGVFKGDYSFASRFEDGTGTNPEELIGAAHAGCFSMALAGILAEAGYQPQSISTEAAVKLEKQDDGFKITKIILHTVAQVPDIDKDTFVEHAQQAKAGCPVSQALAVDVELNAELKS